MRYFLNLTVYVFGPHTELVVTLIQFWLLHSPHCRPYSFIPIIIIHLLIFNDIVQPRRYNLSWSRFLKPNFSFQRRWRYRRPQIDFKLVILVFAPRASRLLRFLFRFFLNHVCLSYRECHRVLSHFLLLFYRFLLFLNLFFNKLW